MTETEIKIKIKSVEDTVSRIERAGFKEFSRRTFEDNTLFDFPDFELKKKDQLIRLRKYGNDTILTFKKPCKNRDKRFKKRIETEVKVSDPDNMRNILNDLNLMEIFRYQKYRAVYKKKQTFIMVDETPAGNFIEIEGEPAEIIITAETLGYTEKDFICSNYRTIHIQNSGSGDMVFK